MNSAKTGGGDDLGSGEKWLVQSDRVSIQARFVENRDLPDQNLFVGAVAVGGAFLKGNTLVIGSLQDQITWNGMEILEEEDSEYDVDLDGDVVKATRSKHSSLVGDMSTENPGVNIELPLGVSLIVNRLSDHVNIAIKMPQQQGGQDGLCGNFNGVGADDSLDFVSQRLSFEVTRAQSLFK